MRTLALFCLLCAAVGLSLACSGSGSSGDAQVQPEKLSLKVEMVYPEDSKLNKFDRSKSVDASLLANRPFRIGTDLKDSGSSPPGDPVHATHVRARFYQDLDPTAQTLSADITPVAEAISPILRYTTNPSEVDVNSRKVSVTGVYGDNLTLTLELGMDFGETVEPRVETVFYTGRVDHIRISGSKAIVAGVESDKISVGLKTNIDRNRGIYTVQGYLDYSEMPLVFFPEVEVIGENNQFSNTSFVPLNEGATSPPDASRNAILGGNMFDPLAYFFEMPGLPLSQTFFVANANSGPSDNISGNIFLSRNMPLSGLITPEEALSGNVLLLDWETTVRTTLATWYEHPASMGSSGNLARLYDEMGKVYPKLKRMLDYSKFGSAQTLSVTPEELSLLQLIYLFLRDINVGDILGAAVQPRVFDTKVAAFMGSGFMGESINHFFFNGNVIFEGNVLYQAKGLPLEVDLTAIGSENILLTRPLLSDNLIVNPSGAFSGNYVSLSDNITGPTLLDLFNEKVGSPYSNANIVLNYIESITDIKTFAPDLRKE